MIKTQREIGEELWNESEMKVEFFERRGFMAVSKETEK